MIVDGDSEIPEYSKVCSFCAHLLDDGLGRKCKAFPGGIPMPIWMGENKHTEPYSGDGGVTFSPSSPSPNR